MNRKELIDQLRHGLSTVAGSADLNDALLRALLAGNSLLVEHYSAIISLRKSMERLGSMLEPGLNGKPVLSNMRCIPEFGVTEFLAACSLVDDKAPEGKVLKTLILLENVGTISPHLAVFLETLLRGGTASHHGVPVRVPDLFLMVAEQDRSDRDAVARLHASLAKGFGMKLCLDLPDEEVEFLQLSQPAILTDTPQPVPNFMVPADLRLGILRDIDLPKDLVRQAIQFANRVQDDDRVATGGRPGQVALADWLNAARVEACLRGAAGVEWQDFRATAHAILDHRVRLHTRTLEKSAKIIDAALEASGKPALTNGKCQGQKKTGTADLVDPDLSGLYAEVFKPMSDWLKKKVLGRDDDDGDYSVSTLDLVLLTLFAGGHILLEDFPGSGKSYLAQTLGHMIEDDREEEPIDILSYNRIQCTPDLLPSDITGYMMLENGQMRFRRGPVFAYVLLLDEINRTTPKVQSSMLQAMAERQVSIDDRTYDLSSLFFVIATQNPLDKLGTYELPYAQLDRFLFKRQLPAITDHDAIKKIMKSDFGGSEAAPRIPATRIMATSKAIVGKTKDGKEKIPVPERVDEFILNISAAIGSRCESNYGSATNQSPDHRLKQGSQPSVRTLQRLIPALKTLAWIKAGGRDCEVTIEHVKLLCCDWLRHRILPATPSAGVSVDDMIKGVIKDAMEQDARNEKALG
jgi:MoxR-like ATPase